MQRLGVKEYLRGAHDGRIVDVRSPAEYAKGHIPGAINIPIFTNKERAEVGTVYKQQSREDAILLGLDIVGPKLRKIADEGKAKAIDSSLFVYCWRGGMRSEKMAWLFELNGLQTFVLDGGYKNYRNYGAELIEQFNDYVVLQGPTGSGKTELIRQLGQQGEQVIDLEKLANHKGSAFGGLGQPKQPSTQLFQNRIYQLLESFDRTKPVWLESESATIGRVYLPEALWLKMNTAQIVYVKLPVEIRIQNILDQYGQFPKELLIQKVEQLRQKLGGLMVKEISTDISNDDLYAAVEKLLVYYDKTYSFSAELNKVNRPIEVNLKEINPEKNAGIIIDAIKQVAV